MSRVASKYSLQDGWEKSRSITEVQKLHLARNASTVAFNSYIPPPQPSSPKHSMNIGLLMPLFGYKIKNYWNPSRSLPPVQVSVSHTVYYTCSSSALLFKPLLDRHCVKNWEWCKESYTVATSGKILLSWFYAVELNTHPCILVNLCKQLTLPSTVIRKSISKMWSDQIEFCFGASK